MLSACFCSMAQRESKSRFSSRLHPVLPFPCRFPSLSQTIQRCCQIFPRNKEIKNPSTTRSAKISPRSCRYFYRVPNKNPFCVLVTPARRITPPRLTFLLILLYKISTCLPSLKLVLLPYTKRASACIVHFRYRSRSSFPKIFILFIEPLFCRAAGLRSPLQIPAHIQTVPGHLRFLP